MEKEVLKYYDDTVVCVGDLVKYIRKGERVLASSKGKVKSIGKKKITLESGFMFYPKEVTFVSRGN